MKGAHDLGGKQGFGAINPEPETREPVFHGEWERRIFACNMAVGMLGKWNIDESRHARERQTAEDYLRHSYYENWLAGLETLLAEKHLLDSDQTGSSLRVPNPDAASKILFSGGPTLMRTDKQAIYAVGEKVRLRNVETEGHTRAPAYAQGATGIIVDRHGCHVFPDQNAHGQHVGEHLYSVQFDGVQLWGAASENLEVCIDLWEPYLESLDN